MTAGRHGLRAVTARRRGVLVMAVAVPLLVAARLALPTVAPPLYDGLIVEEPYRYLAPSPGAEGSPNQFRQEFPVIGRTSPQVVAATSEQPPQAQMITSEAAFPIAAGVRTITATIEAVEVAAPPATGQILGNVYRFAVVDDTGRTLNPTSRVTLVLRAPSVFIEMTIAHLQAGKWVPIKTDQAGQPRIYTANSTQLGDFAVIGSGPATSAGASAGPSHTASPTAPGQGSGGGFDPIPLLIGLGIGTVAIVILLAAVRPPETQPKTRPRPRSKRRKR